MSERKEKAKAYEADVVQLVKRKHPQWAVAEPPSDYATIDGIAYHNTNQQLIAIYEIKCRNQSFSDLISKYNSEMLVDASKLESMQVISRMLRIPSYLFSYLLKDGFVLKTKITNDNGLFVCNKIDEQQIAPAGLDKENISKKMSKVKIDGTEILSTSEATGAI